MTYLDCRECARLQRLCEQRFREIRELQRKVDRLRKLLIDGKRRAMEALVEAGRP